MAIDAEAQRVTTDRDMVEADVLVVALGADYDYAATPGLVEGGHEFYSFTGGEPLSDFLPSSLNSMLTKTGRHCCQRYFMSLLLTSRLAGEPIWRKSTG